jgi:hypothetical protein
LVVVVGEIEVSFASVFHRMIVTCDAFLLMIAFPLFFFLFIDFIEVPKIVIISVIVNLSKSTLINTQILIDVDEIVSIELEFHPYNDHSFHQM